MEAALHQRLDSVLAGGAVQRGDESVPFKRDFRVGFVEKWSIFRGDSRAYSLVAWNSEARNARADIHGSKHDRMTAFQQMSRVQLVHGGFFQFDLQIELMNLMCPSETI
jgi:hypothetical protein